MAHPNAISKVTRTDLVYYATLVFKYFRITILLLALPIHFGTAFVVRPGSLTTPYASKEIILNVQRSTGLHNMVTSALNMSNLEDDVSNQLHKAKELLAKAKAKIADNEQRQRNSSKENLKSSNIDINAKKDKVVKSKNPDSGLFTTDGEMMAELSEDEDWEVRSILDVFEEEFPDEDSERRAADKKERDIAMAMFNLRKSMFDEDYQKIFDQKDWRIGDV